MAYDLGIKGSKVSIKKIGSWAGVTRMINNLPKDCETARQKALNVYGEVGKQIITQHMESQDLGWAALSKHTINRKRRSYPENATNKWRESDEMMKMLTFIVEDDKVSIGIPAGAVSKRTQTLYSEIANMLEFGNYTVNTIPSRPLFRPSLSELIYWTVTHPEKGPAGFWLEIAKKYK